MGNVAELDTTRLVIAAIIGLALLLVLIIKFKVHAMLSILIGAMGAWNHRSGYFYPGIL